MRRYFNPEVYRIVLFDQRSSGRSTPHASEPGIDLSTNTTVHLIADIERLRQLLGIKGWLVLGGSWGSTLALAYAERHPDRVTEVVLNGIATTTTWEIDWITRGVGIFFPEAWARFRDGVPEAERGGSLVEAYHRLLMSPDPAIHEQAARDWCDWEMAIVAVHANHKPHPRYEQPAFRLGFARLVTHYWRHEGWLQGDILLREANRLSGIPGVLIHGRLDLCSPLITPWRLTQNWPGGELVIVSEAGHDARDLKELKDRFPRLARVWADGVYAGRLVEWAEKTAQFVLDIVCKPKGQIGFSVLPWRWIVERTFAWLGNYRRLARDYEISPRTSEAWIKIAMIHIMVRRLA